MTEKNMKCIDLMLYASNPYSDKTVEATLIAYICSKLRQPFCYKGEFADYEDLIDQVLLDKFNNIAPPLNIELIIEFFESLLEKDNITENGIVFTPQYIADYISENTISSAISADIPPNVIDPGCGCGIFLVSAAAFLHQKLQLGYVDIFNRCIYGIDLDPDNVRRCKIVLNIYVLLNGESNATLRPNIICADSLKIKWSEIFQINAFDYVVGNPPYVNTHDMSRETAAFLKKTFKTTKSGVYNIFYAFIEWAMEFLHSSGKLGYIVPNNFLTIKSAEDLRRFIAEHKYLERIIDFADNMVFKPVRTYNCIILLGKKPCPDFEYSTLEKVDDIQKALLNVEFERMSVNKLDVNGWKLVDKLTLSNLQKIEGQFQSIRTLIRTGIATLRDDVYMVDCDGVNYYKIVDGTRYTVESTLVKRLYKVPDLKSASDINARCRHIIFPYKKGRNGFEIVDESELKSLTPLTYQYLSARRAVLDERDKGKGNPVAWYAYGRTQGLNKYGMKLLFPAFASYPRFTLIEDELALFCNGYAVFESDYLELPLLARILNSRIMHYYVSNTSYSIEGGYYCYQKKYIEKFSIPLFTAEEITMMEAMDQDQLDNFLFSKYGLTA